MTTSVREAILAAFDEVGGVAWLVALARREPVAFARLLAKMLPQALTVQDERPVVIVVDN